MKSLFYPQWRDRNAETSYPFADDASLASQDGRLQLTTDWLVDAAIYAAAATAPVHISTIVVVGNRATIFLMDSEFRPLGSGVATKLSESPIAVYDGDSQPVATLVPSNSANASLFAAGDGTYQFSSTDLRFVASTTLQAPAVAFGGFRIGDTVLTGNRLVLVGERGIQLTVEETSEVTGDGQTQAVSLIRIHAMGDPQALMAACSDPARLPPRPIRQVVFQYGDYTQVCEPDALGNILILSASPSVADSALRVLQQASGLVFVLTGASI